jgi:phage tail protein X
MGRYTRNRVLTKVDPNGTRGIRYYRGVKYPEIALSPDDIYVYAEEGDRFDILSNNYYSDSSLWWIISSANPSLPQDSYFLPLGIQIRIPTNIGAIQSAYNNLNGF